MAPPVDPLIKEMFSSMMANVQSLVPVMNAANKAIGQFADNMQEVFDKSFGTIDIKAKEVSEEMKNVQKDYVDTAKKFGDKYKEQQKSYIAEQIRNINKQVKSTGVLTDTQKSQLDSLSKYNKELSAPTFNDALKKTIPVYGDISTVLDGIAAGTAGAMAAGLAVTALVELFKQLWQYGGTAAKAVNLYAMQGGILNDSLERASETTKNFYSAFVDTEEAMSVATTMLNNYGGTVAKSAAEQDQLTEDLAHTSVYLAKMGPMFGMTGEQLGQTMSGLSARFHMSMRQLIPAFDATTRLAMGLGISTTDLSSIFMKSGDQMRWFSGRGGLAPVMNSFMALGKQMVALSTKAGSFWSNLRPGEFIDIMQKVTDLWSKTSAETYMALKQGAAPTTMSGLARGIEEFYTKGPVEALRTIATGLTQKITAGGAMSQRDAFLMMSRTGPFAELGRSAPAMLEVLTSMTEEQARTAGKTGDMNAFLKIVADRFPAQAKDLETLRETQVLMEDPMKVLVRTVQKILTELHAVAWVFMQIGAGAGGLASIITGEPSSATRSLDKPRGL